MANYRDTRAILERLHAQEIDVDQAMELLGKKRPKGRPAKQPTQKVETPPTRRQIAMQHRLLAALTYEMHRRTTKNKTKLKGDISEIFGKGGDKYVDRALELAREAERSGKIKVTKDGKPVKVFSGND